MPPDCRRARRRAPFLLPAVVGLPASALALVAGLLLVVLGAAPASAHASLVRASPADGSAVATAPTIVSLTFDEALRMPSVILVTDADGASVVQGKTSVVNNIVSIRVRAGAAGTYSVVYRVVSADGHPEAGRLAFTVGAASPGRGSTGQVTAAAGHQHESNTSNGGTRVVAMIAALSLVGGVGLLTVRRWAPDLWGSS